MGGCTSESLGPVEYSRSSMISSSVALGSPSSLAVDAVGWTVAALAGLMSPDGFFGAMF